MGFKLKGLDKFKRASKKKQAAALRGLSKGLYREGEGIMSVSKQVYVPVDTGTLRNSGHVEFPRRIRNKLRVVLGFGGPAAPYALFVHEDLQAFHEVGEAKYLEKPVRKARHGMARRLARDVRRELRK